MPLINIGNRNSNTTVPAAGAPVSPASTPASPNDTPIPTTPIEKLAPLPDKELPRAQEIPVNNPVPVVPEVEIKPTGTQQIVQQKQEINNLSNQISNIANTMPKPAAAPAPSVSINDIMNQAKQAVSPAEQVQVKAIQPSTPTVDAKDPAANLDEKLNRLNNLDNAQPASSNVEVKPVSSPIMNTTQPAPLPSLESGALTTKSYTLDDYLEEAMKQNASDVHISVGYRVMIRVNGELKTIESPLVSVEFVNEYVKHLLKGRTADQSKIFEYDMTYSLRGRRFRINIFKETGSFAIAARVISETIPTVEQLDLPPLMKEFSKYPNGLVLVTGPTGSGKSTTIASIINLINITDSKHIITLEDPVEYIFPKALSIVDQREFGQDFESWSNALRAILRQDPNIVLVGEMRDLETVEAALRIAETGHLVFATLHTNSASQTVDRIIDMFPAEKQEQVKVQLASVLQAVISQRLVKTLNNSRVAAMEILIGTSAVKNTIRESKGIQLDNIIQTGADLGMISMEKSLVKLVKEGKVASDVAKVIANRPTDFDILLSKSI